MTTTMADPAHEIVGGTPPRVLVLGGGVAGLTAALELRRRLGAQAAIALISDHAQLVLGPALVTVPFGRSALRVHVEIAQTLQRRGIGFVEARVTAIDPECRIVQAGAREMPYDYLLIATGPGEPGEPAAQSIHSEPTALEAGVALKAFLEAPGPAVVGLARGASYFSAAYEFVLALDAALRRHGVRDHASITFVTPEAQLGHMGVGYAGAQPPLERLFAAHGTPCSPASRSSGWGTMRSIWRMAHDFPPASAW